jgi:nucleotide-binding universal stress UspA family protein
VSGLAIRRILVALDNSPSSLAAAHAAAELAGALGAELTALFVEDARLLDLGRLPFAREIDPLTTVERELPGPYVESQLRASAGRARASIARLAAELGTPWSFRTARGSVAGRILAAAAEADLVAIGRTGWSPARRGRLGSTVHSLLAHGGSPLLLLTSASRMAPPVLVLFDDSAQARHGLQLATGLAERWDAPLSVVLVGPGPQAPALRDAAATLIGERRPAARLLAAPAAEAALPHWIALQTAGLVVVPVGASPLSDDLLITLLERLTAPVLAVPPPRERAAAGAPREAGH